MISIPYQKVAAIFVETPVKREGRDSFVFDTAAPLGSRQDDRARAPVTSSWLLGMKVRPARWVSILLWLVLLWMARLE
jgi:hypothetical protein